MKKTNLSPTTNISILLIFLLFSSFVTSCNQYNTQTAISAASGGMGKRKINIFITEVINKAMTPPSYAPVSKRFGLPRYFIARNFTNFLSNTFNITTESEAHIKIRIYIEEIELSHPTHLNKKQKYGKAFHNFISISCKFSIKYDIFTSNDVLINSFYDSAHATEELGYEQSGKKSNDRIKNLTNYATFKAVKQCLNKLMTSVVNNIYYDETLLAYEQKLVEKNTQPAQLIANFHFSDNSSIQPNSIIDPGEKSTISATVTNKGAGIAYDVKIGAESQNKNIQFSSLSQIGDIQPGETKTINIPLNASLNLNRGTASLRLTAHEKRGYNSRPTELQIPTARLQKPSLAITSYNLNDSSGLANGDGDGIVENNETIELTPFIKNSGEGDGLQVEVKLTEVSNGIEIVKGRDQLAAISTGGVNKAILAFKVPHTYAGNEIRYSITATDIRGMQAKKSYTIPFTSKKSILACSYQIFNSDNSEASGLENGKSYLLKLFPKNKGANSAEGVHITLSTNTTKVAMGPFKSNLGRIAPLSQGQPTTIPFTLDRSYVNSSLDFTLSISQKHFGGLNKIITLPVIVSQPKLTSQIVLLNGTGEKTFPQNSSPKFRVSVSNNGVLNATGVVVHFMVNNPDIKFKKSERIGTIKAGENQYRDFGFFVMNKTEIGEIPIQIEISQDDFNEMRKIVSFQIESQTAIVQKVAGVGTQVKPSTQSQYTGPPQFFLNSPNHMSKTYKKTIDLHGSVITFGPGNAVQNLSVLVNGKSLIILPVNEDIRLRPDRLTTRVVAPNKIVFDGEITLASGENKIKIISTDRNNQKKTQVVNVFKKARLGDIYAVVVGIGEFADTSLNLKYARSDAEKFYNFLRSKTGGNLADNRVILLTDHKANRAAIIKSLTKFLGMAGPDDTVEIYFATHGIKSDDGIFYFLTHNSDIDNLFGTAFSQSDFNEIVSNNIQAGKIIIYLDACHAELIGLSKMYARRGVSIMETNQEINSFAAQMSKYTDGVVTFSASSASGYSVEDRKWDGGVFTYHLLKGLQGEANENDDEWISVGELDNYLASEVRVDTRGKQKPKMNGTLKSETPVAKIH